MTKSFSILKDSERFHHILEVTLAVGNYLNGTGPRGGAWGFRLDSFERIEETKSFDNKENLAFFVIRKVWKRYCYPIFEQEELEKYKIISKSAVAQCQSDIAEVKRNLQSLEKAADSHVKDDPNDRADQVFAPIVAIVKTTLEELVAKQAALEEAYKKCSEFYCEDHKRQQSD